MNAKPIVRRKPARPAVIGDTAVAEIDANGVSDFPLRSAPSTKSNCAGFSTVTVERKGVKALDAARQR
jgi:hypothetical protein